MEKANIGAYGVELILNYLLDLLAILLILLPENNQERKA